MNKIKLLTIISLGLLISNLLLIGFIVFKKPGPNRNEGPRDIIIEKLHLNAKQIEQYDQLIAWHRKEVGQTDENIKSIKNELYKNIKKENNLQLKDSLIKLIANNQIQLENVHVKHFEDLKNICTKEQLPAFEELTKELANFFSKGKPRPQNNSN
ncbi:MAG: hypothetical protein HQ463_05305 [Bacteroidetes bacterium]|nr:hypothetical protein [Bacteroidota bacterium]